MKKLFLAFVAFVAMNVMATPNIQNVTAKQRYPWNGLVDITCKVSGMDETTKGFEFFASAIVSDLGITNRLSHLWIMKDGVKSTDKVVKANGTYHLLWDAKADLGEVYYTNMVVCVTVDNKVQLWEGGPYWATMNIGAEKPEDYGYYFWWGDTVGYKRENDKWVASNGLISNFEFCESNTPTCGKSISALQSTGWITSDGVLAPAHDAAQVQWGREWRMPTAQELNDLCYNQCDWTWTTENGVNGYVVRGRGGYASNSIFLPCNGNGQGTSLNPAGSRGTYWSSVPDFDNASLARGLYFNSNRHDTDGYYRYRGQCVRPLQGFTIDGETVISKDSKSFLLDTTDPLITSPITYNSSWTGNNSEAVVVIADNGVEVKRVTGEGEFTYSPTTPGKHTLTYTTYIDDVAQSEVYSATIFADWKYTVNNGKATITETTFVSGNVLVPSEINGYEVTAVADSVFKNSDELVSVTVPSGISMSMIDGVTVIRGNYPCVMGGDAKWTNDEDGSLRSGKIGDNSKTWVEMRVAGNGRLTFKWKASTESFYDRKTSLYEYYDYGYLVVDDTPKGGVDVDDDLALQGVAIGGEIGDWQAVTIDVRGGGEHALRWVYEKDGQDNPALIGEDCIWLNDIVWTPMQDPIPELPSAATAEQVAAALEGSADAKLAGNITDAATYAAYRTWAQGLTGVTPDQVKDSPNAWLSYALDTDALITAAPKEGDVIIDTFESAATDGAFEFTVMIDDIEVGDNALEANIRKVFDIEGAEKLASGDAGFSPDNVEVNAAAPQDGNVKFTVMPNGGGEGARRPTSFFFRVKMKQ